VTVLLVATWIASGWQMVRWKSATGTTVGVGCGGAVVGHQSWQSFGAAWSGWLTGRSIGPFGWWIELEHSGGDWVAVIPLWLPAGMVLLATCLAWRADALARGDRLGRFRKCNYDRAGIAADAKCPECGSDPKSGGWHRPRPPSCHGPQSCAVGASTCDNEGTPISHPSSCQLLDLAGL
jgi:hypothetical protein